MSDHNPVTLLAQKPAVALFALLALSGAGRADDVVSPLFYDSPGCILYPMDLGAGPELEIPASGLAVPDVPRRKQAELLQITARDVVLPAWLAPHLRLATDIMREAWAGFVPNKPPPATPIELLLVADRRDFESMRGQLAPGLEGISGFYSEHSGQAVVLYDARVLESVRRTAIHEISHLLTAAYLGPAPRWLAEGLAEYFEPMYIERAGAALGPNRRHVGALDVSQPALLDFLQLSLPQWQGESAREHYATAWSLIFFLMDSQAGRDTLAHVLATASANVCKPLRLTELLAVYPGGAGQLEADWRQWVAGTPFAMNQHMLRQPR